jgi:hypothetical protein
VTAGCRLSSPACPSRCRGKQVGLKVTSFEQKGNTVGVRTDVGGKGFNGPSGFTFVLDGDKVREMRITAD